MFIVEVLACVAAMVLNQLTDEATPTALKGNVRTIQRSRRGQR
jgi:hypothetical protein